MRVKMQFKTKWEYDMFRQSTFRDYTLKGLVSQLKEHKFKPEGIRTNEVKIPFIGTFSVLGDWFPSFGDGLVVKFRK